MSIQGTKKISFHNKKIWYENELYNVEKVSVLVERERERERDRETQRESEKKKEREREKKKER